MKNWQITGFFAILILGFLLESGCTSTALNNAEPVAVSTSTPEIVNVTVLITPIPAATNVPVQDPIIGVWRYSTSDGYDDRLRFNADGTLVHSFHSPTTLETNVFNGTWSNQGSNLYRLLYNFGISESYVYDPAQTAIYDVKYTHLLLTPYQGDVAKEDTAPKNEIYTVKTNTNTQSNYPHFTRVDQIQGKWEATNNTETFVITIENDEEQTVYLDVTTTKPGYIGNFLQGNIVATGADRFQMSFKPDYTTPAELGGILIKISKFTWKYDEATGELVSDANDHFTYRGPVV